MSWKEGELTKKFCHLIDGNIRVNESALWWQLCDSSFASDVHFIDFFLCGKTSRSSEVASTWCVLHKCATKSIHGFRKMLHNTANWFEGTCFLFRSRERAGKWRGHWRLREGGARGCADRIISFESRDCILQEVGADNAVVFVFSFEFFQRQIASWRHLPLRSSSTFTPCDFHPCRLHSLIKSNVRKWWIPYRLGICSHMKVTKCRYFCIYRIVTLPPVTPSQSLKGRKRKVETQQIGK